MCARPDCVTRKTLPPLSLHDPEPANWSLVCSTQATKVPAKAFKLRRVVQSLSVNVQCCPPSQCCRADGTDGGCLAAWNGLIQENKLLDFGWDYWEMARFIQIRVQLQKKTDKRLWSHRYFQIESRSSIASLSASAASLILRDMSMQTLSVAWVKGRGESPHAFAIARWLALQAHAQRTSRPLSGSLYMWCRHFRKWKQFSDGNRNI